METKYRILIIDSSIAMRKGLRTLLSPLEADFFEASNGQEGLRILTEHQIDIIITSVDMPQMDGLELCRHVKALEQTREIPVIILSSFDTDIDIDNAIQAGAAAYIEKREARSRLHDTVQKVLSIATAEKPERTIMVVDDSRPIRTLVQKGLMEAGFRVVTAENGKDALELIKQQRPDLILSDINMPEMDGFELCEALHVDPALSTIPFVVMSSMNDRDQMRRIIQYGATDYMIKPFSVDEMVIHIERFLKDHLHLLLKEKERLDTRREMILGSIHSLLSIQEVRDPWLKSHADRVSQIASGMVTLAGANKRDIEVVTLGAQLHDIGKIALRDEILFNPQKLSEEDLALFKQHPRIGSNILEHIPYLPSDILSIVFFHHEQPNGKGYPVGLGADEIPEYAGITAVADRYVRLTEAPPYGKGLPPDTAVPLIEAKSNTELGRQAVSLFVEWIHTQNSSVSGPAEKPVQI